MASEFGVQVNFPPPRVERRRFSAQLAEMPDEIWLVTNTQRDVEHFR